MQVPLLDLKGQYAPLRAEIESAIREVCDSATVRPRSARRGARTRVAAYSQREHGIGVSSGTDALLVALMALDIGPGDEVVTSAVHVFRDGGRDRALGRAAAVLRHRSAERSILSPRCGRGDASRSTASERGDRLVNRRTGGVVKALHAGASLRADGRHGRAHGHRAAARSAPSSRTRRRRSARRLPTAAARAASATSGACRSFPTKNLGAFGDAGMCVDERSARSRSGCGFCACTAASRSTYHSVIGGNFRLDELQAAVLVDQARAPRRLDAGAPAQRRALRRS